MADLEGAPPARAPPTAQNFLNFMQFFAKFGKIICWPPRVGAPFYGESWIRSWIYLISRKLHKKRFLRWQNLRYSQRSWIVILWHCRLCASRVIRKNGPPRHTLCKDFNSVETTVCTHLTSWGLLHFWLLITVKLVSLWVESLVNTSSVTRQPSIVIRLMQ